MTLSYELHGLKLSYFTGKLEAYMRAKGLPFRFVEMDMADFRRCAAATGVAQMPQLRAPDGTWRTDTTAIIAGFEDQEIAPAFRPHKATGAFLSRLLEDAFDEWLWRPALYYRWAFSEDARLMGRQIARTLMRDLPVPLALRTGFITARQKREYLRSDGVTAENGDALARQYLAVLDLLEPVLARRPFLFGDRPCEADFGLFGPMFRHFSSDPTPASILRERAPNVLAWTARMWCATPGTLAGTDRAGDPPDDLDPLLRCISQDYLPYLQANLAAVANGSATVRCVSFGATFDIPVSPYRAEGWLTLRHQFEALTPDARAVVRGRLGGETAFDAPAPVFRARPPVPGRSVTNRHWR
jgi:glutathione S-transferase